MLSLGVAELRDAQADISGAPDWNRIDLFIWPDVVVPLIDLAGVARRLAPMTLGLGLEQVLVHCRLVQDGDPTEVVVRIANQPGTGVTLNVTPAADNGRCSPATTTAATSCGPASAGRSTRSRSCR